MYEMNSAVDSSPAPRSSSRKSAETSGMSGAWSEYVKPKATALSDRSATATRTCRRYVNALKPTCILRAEPICHPVRIPFVSDATNDAGGGAMRRLSAVLGAALLVAVSCGQTPTSSTSTSPSPAASASEQPQAGGRIVFGATGDPKTMQPVISTDTQSSFIWGWFYLGLTRANYKTGDGDDRRSGRRDPAEQVFQDGLEQHDDRHEDQHRRQPAEHEPTGFDGPVHIQGVQAGRAGDAGAERQVLPRRAARR